MTTAQPMPSLKLFEPETRNGQVTYARFEFDTAGRSIYEALGSKLTIVAASPTGWICARCGRSWSPAVLECPCKPETEELKK